MGSEQNFMFHANILKKKLNSIDKNNILHT